MLIMAISSVNLAYDLISKLINSYRSINSQFRVLNLCDISLFSFRRFEYEYLMMEKASELTKNKIFSSVNKSISLKDGKANLECEYLLPDTSYREKRRFWRMRRKNGTSVYLVLFTNNIEPFIVWYKNKRSLRDPRGIIWVQHYRIVPTWSKLTLSFTPQLTHEKPYLITFKTFSEMESWITRLSESVVYKENSIKSNSDSLNLTNTPYKPNPLDFTRSLDLSCHFATGFGLEKDATLTSSMGSGSVKLNLSPITCYNISFRRKKAKEKLFDPCASFLDNRELFFLGKIGTY